MKHSGRYGIATVLLGAASLATAQLPGLDLTDGSSPVVISGFDCAPPSVDLAADSSGITMTLTSYFATNSDYGKNLPVANRTGFVGGVFTRLSSEADTTDRIGDSYFNSDTGLLDSTLFYNPNGNEEHQQSYPGYCDTHSSALTDRNGLMDQHINSQDTITTQCAGQNHAAGGWTIQNSYPGSGTCTGRRVATYHRTIDVFRLYDFVSDTDLAGGDTTLAWRFTTVELTEAETAGGTVTARYHTHAFTLDFSQTAAVTVTVDSGALLTPATLQVTSMDMARTSGISATIQWTFSSFLQQPVDYMNEEPLHMFIDEDGWGSAEAIADGFGAVCALGPQITSDQTPVASIVTSSLPPAIQDSLHSSIQSSANADLRWKQYDFSVTCVFTKIGGDETLDDDLKIPTGIGSGIEISFAYAIMETCVDVNSGCVEVTDTSSRPTLAFSSTTTLPGDDSVTVILPLEGTLIDLNTLPTGELGDPAKTAIEHIDYNQGSIITSGSVAWTQAVGFQVALQHVPDRTFWHLTPQMIIITAHSVGAGAAGTQVTNDHTYIHPGDKLDTDWCGLDQSGSTLVGAIALSDQAGSGGFVPGDTSAFYDANPADSYITEGLNTVLTGMLANNKVLSTDLEDFAGLGPTVTGQDSYVVFASDGSYVVPMRNQLKLAGGTSGGFSIRFCAITHLDPTINRRLSSRRRMLSTAFTMTMNDDSDANNQKPLPGSGDIANTYFEAQPTSGGDVVTAASDADDDEISITEVFFTISGIMLVLFVVYILFTCICSQKGRGRYQPVGTVVCSRQ